MQSSWRRPKFCNELDLAFVALPLWILWCIICCCAADVPSVLQITPSCPPVAGAGKPSAHGPDTCCEAGGTRLASTCTGFSRGCGLSICTTKHGVPWFFLREYLDDKNRRFQNVH